MMDMNNNNLNNNIDPNSNINQIRDDIKSNTISIGVVIGLIVLIGTILIIINLTSDVITKFDKLKTKAETMFPGGLNEAFGGMLEDGEFDAGKDYYDQEQDESHEFNPYEKYTNIEWCGPRDEYKGMELYIENGAVYSKNDDGTTTKWTTIGTPIKLHLDPPTAVAYVLTKEGKVYSVCYESCTQELSLDKYTIIDMAYLNNYTNEQFYFLTSEGELIDINGVPYDKYGFVGSVMFDKMLYIPIDKNGFVYFYNNENNTYIPVIDETESKLKASKIYAFRGYALIQSVYGKWYKYEGESNIAKVEIDNFTSKVEIKTTSKGDSLVLHIINGTTKEYLEPIGMYDVANNKEVFADELKDTINAKSEMPTNLEQLSDTLKQQVVRYYDAKTLTGAEVLAIFQQYSNSDVSIVLKTKSNGTAYTGKYKIDETKLKEKNTSDSKTMEAKPYPGGVFYLEQGVNFDSQIKRTEFTKLHTDFHINAGQTYYSSIIKDNGGNVFGIVFVEK